MSQYVCNSKHRCWIWSWCSKMRVYVRIFILTAMVMKSSVFCDITPCSPLNVNRCFGGTWRLHIQGQPRKKPEWLCLPPTFMLVSCLDYSSTPKWGATCSSETSLDFQRLHSVISQKIDLFMLVYFHWIVWISVHNILWCQLISWTIDSLKVKITPNFLIENIPDRWFL
jgi:hypothetical protein